MFFNLFLNKLSILRHENIYIYFDFTIIFNLFCNSELSNISLVALL